jgi:hypothetical protein
MLVDIGADRLDERAAAGRGWFHPWTDTGRRA